MGWNSLPPVIFYKLFDKRNPFYNLLTCLFLIEGKGRRGWGEGDNERMVHGCVWDIVLYCINVLQYIRNSDVSQPPQGSTINVIRGRDRERELRQVTRPQWWDNASPFFSFLGSSSQTISGRLPSLVTTWWLDCQCDLSPHFLPPHGESSHPLELYACWVMER